MTRSRGASLALAAAAVLAALALAVAIVGGGGSPSLEERADAVAASLACPVCQNLSVADSTSRVAGEMRRSILEQLRRGKSPDEVRAGFVAAYGDWILLSPPARGPGLLAWILPGVVILGGAALGVAAVRRWGRGSEPA